MAGVYVARAVGVAGFERLFAIKVLHPHLAHEEEFISMFLDEARLAARIRHPNVVPTIDISDTPDAGYYLVMEYIEGDHLGALLQTAWKLGVRLPWPITLRIVVDALDGLAAAHNLSDETGRRLNLVHRDVSPHNVMVSTDGIARITDFGVAKAEVRLSTTREGQFKGKLAYMAPEHASSGDADQRSDLFSMAIILWECLTGRRLFRAENHAATLNKICLEPIPMPSSVDPALTSFDYLLERGLSRDPAQRFQSAEEFAEAIEHAAPALGGLGKQREVAQLVREYASEKLDHDAALIRNAIAQIAQDAGIQDPAAEYPVADRAPVAAPTPPRPAGRPPPARPAQHEPAAEAIAEAVDAEPARGNRWIWAVLVFLVAAGVGAVAFLGSGKEESVKSVPLPARSPAAPAKVAKSPAVPAPEPTGAAAAPVPEAAPAAEAPAPTPPAVTAAPEPATSAEHRGEQRDAVGRRREPRRTRVAGEAAAPATKAAPSPDDLMLNPYRR